MRTTVRLHPEVAAAAQRIRDATNVGLGEAVNQLALAGLTRRERSHTPFQQRTADLGIRVDVTNIGEVLDLLDAYDVREDRAAE